MNDAVFIYCMLKKGQQNINLLLQKYISASELMTLPNGNLSDILQAKHLYAFSTSGFFCLHLYWYYIERVNQQLVILNLDTDLVLKQERAIF